LFHKAVFTLLRGELEFIRYKEEFIMSFKKLNIPKFCFCFTIVFIVYGLNVQSVCSEERHHGSHVHGIAHINVALEKNELYIEVKSPAANIVGFEHSPGNEKEKRAVKEAVETLKAGEKVFKLTSRAGAILKEADVTTGHEDEAHNDDEHEKHDAGHHEHAKKDHDEYHSDFKAVYRFYCKHPDKLKYLDVNLFEQFKGIEKIEVQVLTETKQTALELTPQKNKITF